MYTLFNGDCLEVMKDIPDGSIDAIITDPPYGTTACKWDSVIDLDLMWKQLKRIIKPNGAIVLFGSQPFTSILGASNVEMLRYSWVYEKGKPTNFANAKKMPLKGFEDILVFYNSLPTYNPQYLIKIDKVLKNTGTKSRKNSQKENGDISYMGKTSITNNIEYRQEFTNYPRGIIKCTQETESYHPTQKPVPLMEYLVKTYTNENETVLDFTMGSGSTGVACVNTNRNFIGIEMDKNYFEITKKRIETRYNEKSMELD